MQLNTGTLVTLAADVFSMTTGCSGNVLSVYNAKTGNPNLLELPLTPKYVNQIVNKENEASLSLPTKTLADRAAKVATPVRRFIAHGAASLLVTSQVGFMNNNPYSTEAYMNLTSGTF